jgi:hypothetical protein
MVRLFAICLLVLLTAVAWLTREMWQRTDESAADAARIPASERLTTVMRETLCRSPRDQDTVNWDSRPFGTSELRTALELSPEGKRVGAVRQVYLKVLLRDPFPGDCDGLRQWVDGELPVDEVERRLTLSSEGERIAEVRRVFMEAAGRDPAGWDTASLRYWVESGLAIDQIRARLTAQRPLIGIYYFPWYQSVSGQWGNGATAVTADTPKPLLGPYESSNPNIIDSHVRQMTEAGLDFVIVNLVPGTEWQWANVHTFFQRLKQTPLKAAVMLDDLYKVEPAVKAGWVEKVKAEFLPYPNYFTYRDRPLVLMFASRLDFMVPDVVMRNVYWTNRYGPGANTFNLDSVLYPHDWPFWAESPQPVVNGVVPVMPGYIDTHLGRDDPMLHPRNNGQLYHQQWQRALALKPELIIVYSWNEYFEQSAIEPTQAWGDSYVRWTRCYVGHARAGTTGAC